MSKNYTLLVLFITGFCFSASAQKIKYKDLFILLNAKNYRQAEPFLREFIAQEPNHPNANFNFALFYQDILKSKDILKETDDYLAYSDSATLYFRKASDLMTEKEVKRNDEYYQDYYRRDLRTGKYGVKLADVLFDIEKKIEQTKAGKEGAIKLKKHFELTVQNYDSALSIFKRFTSGFINYEHFLFTAGDDELEALKAMGVRYESSHSNFNNYRSVLESLPKTGYNQLLNIIHFEGFTEINAPDFYTDDVDVHDFKDWAAVTSEIIKNDLMPLRDNMVSYDNKLDELYVRVTEEAQTVEKELGELKGNMLFDLLRKYDEDPLPANLFEFKISEITYYSYINHNKEDGYLDSMNIDFQIFVYQDLQSQFIPLKRSFDVLNAQDVEKEQDFYGEFIASRFGDPDGFKGYLADKQIAISDESDKIQGILDSLMLRAMWAVYENDSIPMFVNDSLEISFISEKSLVVTLDIDTLRSGYWVSGIKVSPEVVSGFIANVNYNFEVNALFVNDFTVPFTAAGLVGIKSHIFRVGIGSEAVVFYTQPPDSLICNVSYINSGAMKWSTTINPEGVFHSLRVDESNAQIVLSFTKEGDPANIEEIRLDLEGNIVEGGD